MSVLSVCALVVAYLLAGLFPARRAYRHAVAEGYCDRVCMEEARFVLAFWLPIGLAWIGNRLLAAFFRT